MEHEDFPNVRTLRQTLRLHADRPGDVERAARLLREGGLVAFPTETVYGLGANALDGAAVATIFEAKQRPSWDPLIVHVSDEAMLARCIDTSALSSTRASALRRAFWPGPLTLLLPRSGAVPDAVTAGRQRVGVRMPSHPVALRLIAEAGVPIAAPSANRFGHTSPTTADHVLADLDGLIDAVLDGGATSVGVESTVLDCLEDPMLLYRPGAVTLEQIAREAGRVEMFRSSGAVQAAPESLPSPGVDLRHYAPKARLVLVADQAGLLAAAQGSPAEERAGAMLPEGWKAGGVAHTFAWGPWHRPEILAQRLFAGLRALDDLGATVILCPLPGESGGMTTALQDRLLKAARAS